MEGQQKGSSRPRTLFTDVQEQFHTTPIREIVQPQSSEWSDPEATGREVGCLSPRPIFRTPVSEARLNVFGFERQPSGSGANTWANN
jgi:hypothetical protein